LKGKLIERKLLDLLDEISSSSPAPGGGSVSALIGALGCALLEMVCNLTIGKKKYQAHEEEVKAILAEANKLKGKFLALVDEDAEAFTELFGYFKLKELTPEQESSMRRAEARCIDVPKTTMGTALLAISLASRLAPICNRNAISDVGCAVHSLRTAFLGAELNVRINLFSKQNEELEAHLLELGKMRADFEQVFQKALEPVLLELGMQESA